jgi:hypothetical protein
MPPAVTFVYTRGEPCARDGPNAQRNLSTVVTVTCRMGVEDAFEAGKTPPGDVLYTDECTAAYNVLSSAGCPVCGVRDYEVSLICLPKGQAVITPRTECHTDSRNREAALKLKLDELGYKAVADVPCGAEIQKELETAKGRTVALGAILALVAFVLIVIGVVLHRLRKRHSRTQQELKKYLDQYGDSLLTKDGEANEGDSESDEVVTEMPSLNNADRI